MSELKVSVSGIRGIWADSLNLKSVMDYTKAFGIFLKKSKGRKVLIGRDARNTGKMLTNYVSSILNSMGISVLDCGIAPTPTVLFGVRKMGLDGGIVITASHNPIEWNALKFVKKGGLFADEKDMEKILNSLNEDLAEEAFDSIGHYEFDDSICELHIREIVKNIDVSSIKKRAFRVVLDPVNSAGSHITQKLLNELGCNVRVVYGEMNGNFERGTEPVSENLTHLTEIIRDYKADIGFAQDPDADRLVLIDENGVVLSEELTLAIALENVLSKEKGDAVINLSTSMINELISDKYMRKCYRTKVGEANVVEGILKYGALIGGEGNGGVIYPRINTARDSLVGIALALELMAARNKKLTELADEIPETFILKRKIDIQGKSKNGKTDLDLLYKKIINEFKDSKTDKSDGVRLEWMEDGRPVWIHVRASNTEPVIRIIGEILIKSVEDKNRLIGIFDRIKQLFD